MKEKMPCFIAKGQLNGGWHPGHVTGIGLWSYNKHARPHTWKKDLEVSSAPENHLIKVFVSH